MKITKGAFLYSRVSKLTIDHHEFQIELEITEKLAKQQIFVSLVHEYTTHIFSFLSKDS